MRSQLVVARSAVPARTSALTYVRHTTTSPVCFSVAVFAGCIGLGYAGFLGAVVAILAVVTVAAHTARYRCIRRHLDDQARIQERGRRDRQRLKLLRTTGPVRIQHYHELRALVEGVEQADEAEAARFELQDLLDHWVKLALGHHRCVEALRMANTNPLPSASPLAETARSPRRRDIQQRRQRHREDCIRRMEQLADELEGVDELVRLVAQRTASAGTELELDRELERRLWELDEVDAALHQLSA
jgi:hypothetical protein